MACGHHRGIGAGASSMSADKKRSVLLHFRTSYFTQVKRAITYDDVTPDCCALTWHPSCAAAVGRACGRVWRGGSAGGLGRAKVRPRSTLLGSIGGVACQKPAAACRQPPTNGA